MYKGSIEDTFQIIKCERLSVFNIYKKDSMEGNFDILTSFAGVSKRLKIDQRPRNCGGKLNVVKARRLHHPSRESVPTRISLESVL
jgi:hypothetical protein